MVLVFSSSQLLVTISFGSGNVHLWECQAHHFTTKTLFQQHYLYLLTYPSAIFSSGPPTFKQHQHVMGPAGNCYSNS